MRILSCEASVVKAIKVKRIRMPSLILLMAVLLSGCLSLPGEQADQKPGGMILKKDASGKFVSNYFDEAQQTREQISAWQLRGSFSYVDPQDTGAGRIQWTFQGQLEGDTGDRKSDVIENEKVRLIGPIGTGSLELVSSDSSASLTVGRESYFGPNVESLLIKVVGWQMPVDELRYWLFGMPSSKVAGHYWLNEQGLLQSLQQSNWEIQFDRYQVYPFSTQPLPQKITAIHRGNQAKVKLVIKQFEAQ